VGKIETLLINGKTVRIVHDVEYDKHRTSPHQLAMQYARTGRYNLYTTDENAIQRVLINSRCIAVIKQAPNGLFVCGHLSNRDRNKLVEHLVTRLVR
jgi:hypothetical protein